MRPHFAPREPAVSSTLTIDFQQPIPLFPLPQCVLLPHAAIPLHVFESRYRTMTRDAIDGRGLIALATFEGDGWKLDYEGNPPVRPIVCIGYIIQHHRLPGGRYNLLVHGVCRARIDREVQDAPYRAARLKPVEQPQTMEIDLAEQRDTIEALLEDAHVSKLAAASAISRWLNDEIPTLAMIDLAAMALFRQADDRYAMLAETDPARRARRLIDSLTHTRRMLQRAGDQGHAKSDDGHPLN